MGIEILINGPGLPLLDLSSGKMYQMPPFSGRDAALVQTFEACVLVEPFTSLAPDEHFETMAAWLGDSALHILVRPGSFADFPAHWCVAPLPVLASIADVSSVKRMLSSEMLWTRCVWVNRGQARAAAELLNVFPNAVLLQSDGWTLEGAVPRFAPGMPMFWTTRDGGPLVPCETVVPFPDPVRTVSILDKDTLVPLVQTADPGSFRVQGVCGRVPEAHDVLRDTVLKSTADSAFAEAAARSMIEHNLEYVRNLP